MNAYVVIFSGYDWTKQRVGKYLDTSPVILNWYHEGKLPGTIFVVSDLDANGVYEEVQKLCPGIDALLVMGADVPKQGWLSRRAWDFMKNPRQA